MVRTTQTESGSTALTTAGVSPPGPPGSGFSPVEIVYHKLAVTVSGDMTFSYEYADGSGIYRKNDTMPPINDSELDGLLQGLQSQTLSLSRGLYNMSRSAPNILIERPCYIAVELVSPANFWFQQGQYGVQIDNTVVSNYCSLYHYDDAWTRSAVAPENCFLICFGGQNIPTSGVRIDDCNYYYQLDQAGGVMLVTLDPHIKNRGGSG